MELGALWQLGSQLGGGESFKGSHRMVEITINLRDSPFYKGLSVNTTFSQIHLDGQYTFKM